MAFLSPRCCSASGMHSAPASRHTARRGFDHLPPPRFLPMLIHAQAIRCCTSHRTASVLVARLAAHDHECCSLAPAPAATSAGQRRSDAGRRAHGGRPLLHRAVDEVKRPVRFSPVKLGRLTELYSHNEPGRKRMEFSESAPPPSCSGPLGPGPPKTKTLVFCEVLGPVPPLLTGIHTQNAVNELAQPQARAACAPQDAPGACPRGSQSSP
jgi:hypothetical protein